MITNCILWRNSAIEGHELWIGNILDPSTLTISYSDVEGGEEAVYKEPGCTLNWLEGNIDDDPLFVSGELGAFYLSQYAAGQEEESPCVDTGNGLAEEIGGTTRTDHVGDIGTIDIGYHYHPPMCTDSDGDGFAIEGGECGPVDCDDSEPAVNPGVVEGDSAGNCSDGKDNDCDGLADLYDPDCGECDVDGDGYEAEICGGDDCDDTDPVVHQGAEEVCANGIDEDCDGEVDDGGDEDGDGYTCLLDCDDTDVTINPGAVEICENGVDDDCDGRVDGDDQDCIADFILELDADYEASTLRLNFIIGTIDPATWSNYLILTYTGFYCVPLWTVPLPVIDPPFQLPISFSLPSVGWIGILSGLLPVGEEPIAELAWVDTGW